MKKIALVVAILASSVLATACNVSVAVKYAAKITLSDSTVISCVKEEWLRLYVPLNALSELSCTDAKGLHITIPANKVVKIEIFTTVDTVK